MKKKRLGEVLHERKRISAETLQKAIDEQRETTLFLGELLFRSGLVSKDHLIAGLEEVMHFRYVDARLATVEKEALKLMPRAAALRYCALPLVREGRRLLIVMAEPQNLHILDELRFLCGMELAPRLGFRSEIEEAIEKCYTESQGKNGDAKVVVPFVEQVEIADLQFLTASSSERNRAAMEEFNADLRNERTPAVRLTSAILSAAVSKKASDIHIEPQALGTVVRVRVDGMLRELTHVPAELQNALVSRIKILADMDIAEKRAPQDGRFLVALHSQSIDLRVSSLPTHYGEKIVMRLLDASATRLGFTHLGFSNEAGQMLAGILSMPQGMLLVTGPTGSGKSTTLYSALNAVRSPTVNIVTVEDPIEYKIEGVNQVQVNAKAGLTFATCLRSMLRQDPNVIMVGEIRDAETAEMALQASQTGHLVLSTLHTNDAISAVTRLLDLGVPSFLIASSVTAVVAQRLVRKLCSCRREVPITREHASRMLKAGIAAFEGEMYLPIGCADCENTGYKGRIGIYELLVFDEEIRHSIRSGTRDDEIRNLARSGGMRLMQDDALEKVKQGLTTMDEVLRVVSFEHAVTARCRDCGKRLAPAFLFCPYCGVGTRQGSGGVPAAPPATTTYEGAD